MFVSITFAFWQLLQLLNTKFPFSQEDHSYTLMNDVTLNPLECNCWMFHFIAGHLMVYLFMLNFMTVTAVSQQRNDPFLSQEDSFVFFEVSNFVMYILKLRLKAKFERINCVAMKLFVKYLRKDKLRISKSETGKKSQCKDF